MAHRTHWLIPNRVVVVTLTGGMMSEEVQRVADSLYDTVSSVETSHIVHMLVDIRETTIQDKIWNYAKVHLRRHPNNGWTIVIGDSRLSGLVMAIFSRMLNTRIHYCDSPEAALRMLIQRDASIAQYMKDQRQPAITARTR